MQLQSAHTVMKVSRQKLIQYLAVFRKHIPGDSTHELHQSMDGIEEVNVYFVDKKRYFLLFFQFSVYFILHVSCVSC